jgi:NAD+ kinase
MGPELFVVTHHVRGEVLGLVREIAGWAAARGGRCRMAAADAAEVGAEELVDASVEDHAAAAAADLVVSLGGDGTMLRAVRLLDGQPVPLLGVNLGQLGYLTEVEAGHATDALDRFVAGPEQGSWRLEERLMLHADAHDPNGTLLGVWTALNEAVVEKRQAGHTVRLLARIDGDPFTTYAADGLIVSTPTGSTAYSLSARGPVVSPRHRALLLTPVAPHMLFDRSLVLDPSETVELEVLGHRDAHLVIDGQSVCVLGLGARVCCRPSSRTARFVRFGERRYHQILKAKFGLMDR